MVRQKQQQRTMVQAWSPTIALRAAHRQQHSRPWHHCWLLLILLLLLGASIGGVGCSPATSSAPSTADLERRLNDDDSPIALNLAIPMADYFKSSTNNRLTTRQLARKAKISMAPQPTTGRPPPQLLPLQQTTAINQQKQQQQQQQDEHKFRFTSSHYNVSIPENSMSKTYVTPEEKMGIELKGPNRRLYDEIKFRIVAGDKDKFFKAEERVVGDFCFLLLRMRTGTVDVLNRERKDRYVLDIRASAKRHHGGKNRLNNNNNNLMMEAQTSVMVTVLDTNDLNPLFYPTEYEVTVTEDTPVHRSIIKVSAEDADLGRNGEIYYSFSEKTEQFAVHPVSGVVSLTRPLRFVEKSDYDLTVLARDRGVHYRNTPRASSAKLTIHVHQVNLHAPEISVRHLPEIMEHSNADTYAIVRVTDRDPGPHGQIASLDIVAGDPDGHFRVRPLSNSESSGEYSIQVLKLLDRETAPQGYNLTLKATDRGTPPRSSYKSVPVHLADLNDNAPIFSREIYEIKVPETAPVNSPIIRLKVSDADQGKNALVFLEIVGGNEGGEFYVNADTGMLYTAVPLDFEKKAFYTLTVSAVDQGNSGTRKQSSAKVKIYVIDTNDNDPEFEHDSMSVELNENEPAGTSVVRVVAKDRDSGENAYISYSIDNIKRVPFEIDHFSGIVRTKQLLDYETMKRDYLLHVRANDWGLPYRRQSEMQLRVRLLNVNDNRPQFEKVDCVGQLARNSPVGTEIITVSAMDFDAGNIISYQIVSGNGDGCFSLDQTSGVLSVACDLADLKSAERLVNVTATDGTHFADVNSIAIQLVNAKRNLANAQSKLLSDETGNFHCHDTGVARRLTDAIAAAEKNNMPSAEDEYIPMPSRYGENVHAPEFVDLPNEIRVNESAPLGSVLAKLVARDRDLGYNGKLVFGISAGDRDSVFEIDPDSGELRVIGRLDRERESEYFLNITVYDLGKPQKSASRMLPVTVLDVNDNPPKFEKALASFRVPENVANGTVIFHANATDPDLGDNAKIAYTLVTDTADFYIHRVTGVLSVNGKLDRERQDSYELRIRATDRNGGDQDDATKSDNVDLENSPLYSEALVHVYVDDINDNAPAFALNSYTVKVREDVPIWSVVAIVEATDPDEGLGGTVVYSFSEDIDNDGGGFFEIDPLSGTVRTIQKLDFEDRQVHTLTIKASDKGQPSLSSETILIVEIVDVNENVHAPQFPDFVVAAEIYENQPIGSLVTQVRAKDADAPGIDSRISYSIRGGDGVGLFSIDDEGNIKTKAVLDVEAKNGYWLTVFAQDHGVVPLSTKLQVYVEVLNENDNTPLTELPVYYPSVVENSPAGVSVVQIRAFDRDVTPQQFTFTISSGNAEGYFIINSTSGLITTSGRKLDRENQAEHILEVTVRDDGKPALSSTTRVVVQVEDVNDHGPMFEEKFYIVQIPATPANLDKPLFQKNERNRNAREGDALTSSSIEMSAAANVAGGGGGGGGSEIVEMSVDALLENGTWETFSPDSLTGDRIFRVLAHDEDIGKNGKIQYSIKSGKGKGKFKIHPNTGMVYSQKGFEAGQEFDMIIKASDEGVPPRSHQARISVQVVETPRDSPNAPVFKAQNQSVEVTEADQVGYLVALMQATDKDGDSLWYDIVDGDPRDEFVIGRDNGNILLAKQLDWETQKAYLLTVSCTDGVNEVRTQLRVKVIDINDHRPEFSESVYRVQISENLVERGERVLQLHAEDADEDKRVFYSLHNAQNQASLRLFHVDSITGALTLNEPLDREAFEEHVLTVMVKDQGTPPKRNYARVLVTVHDHNDHAPLFISEIVQAKVYETAAIGTEVVQVVAVDWDRGDNARLSYSMTSGNVGNVFSIDSELGIIRVARELDLASAAEYILLVKATDHGSPPLSSSIPVHVMVTMADNAAPRFVKQTGGSGNGELAAEIYENEPPGSFVKHLEARATSSLQYYIVEGNVDEAFFVNPSTGVITTQVGLDYEKLKFYNLTIEATSMAGSTARCNVIVHVLDRNDNVPRFLQAIYTGQISEAASIGSLVFSSHSTSSPLVIKAEDADSELNALLNYDIVEELPRKFFHIDSSTGAIRTVMLLDHETIPSFEFHVKVSDLGKPRLSSETTAKVLIAVTDVNDCPPKFTQSDYNTTVLVPTWRNVAVVKLEAFDPDTTNALPGQTSLRYDIIDGNQAQAFQIDSQTGALTISNPENMAASYLLHVRASDGKYSSVAQVNINVENSENSGLVFHKDLYEGTVLENSTKITTVAVLHVLGTVLNEHVVFTILNPTDLFVIGQTSGAISTTGVRFDRETCDRYELVVEAKSLVPKKRVAHVIVNVTVLDINDNCPIFVNLPYYAVVSVDAQKSDVIMKVHAVDLDSGDNGEVRYELKKGYGELFKVARKTGEISLKQNLEGHNREYQLTIAAYDGGISPCSVEVPVNLKVIDRSMPVFDKQFYSVSVLESIEVHSPLSVAIQAESPLNRKLIYSITKGNDFEEFALDFNTALDSNNGPCVIYVVDELDYEEKKEYELTVRATDSVSGIYAEVLVSILVLDVNDCPPEFSQDSYNVSISEAAIFGTELLRLVARDNDTGMNQKIVYAIENRTELGTADSIADLFHIDPEEGIVYLKRSLDHETADSHHFTVIATDRGVPSLSSTAHVWLTVVDMNDNPPKFEQPSYNCFLSEEAERGQFVTVLSASDPDLSDDRLTYTIVGGNDQQTYSIDQSTGILTLINMQNFAEEKMTVLNVSVSDGVYTSFARVKIDILPANRHAPKFSNPIIEASVQENKPAGRLVASVVATDEDFGEYGAVRYSISSDYLNEFFEIHPERGDIITKKCLDREQHKLFEIPVVASDGGGKAGFVIVRVRVIDDNDNTPSFLLKEYKACIHSNYSVNSVFLKVKAVDADEGDNAKIEYSILEPSNSEIKNIFGIKPDTGALFLKESPKSYENQLFQLFIRAKDKGPISRHVDVPLDVFVMGSNDVPPLFERKDDKFFVSEISPIGTPITRLKTVNNSNRTITCRIVSSGNDFPFTVDPKNCSVTLSASLDREKKDSYLIGVLAETDSSPPLTALAEISLHVLDENDHAPEFESNPYSIGVAENIAEGTTILKVIAHDDDLGSNGEVRYSFGTDIGELANVFTIDAYTGWISNLVQLDKEKQPEYKFQVVATDNGNPRHFARTSVLVKLKDYNDHSPAFVTSEEAGYQAAVKEDALPGTVVVELTTTDKDVDMNTPVDYYITAGDPRSQFAIRSTGQVYVAKALDRETIDRYELTVVGTDGKFVFETKVSIHVLDVNDNPPYCLRYRYREVLSEGSHPGIYVLTVLATDYDDEPNAKLRFYLTGDKNEKFSLDKETGVLKTVGQLDRETQAKYVLTAHVQDRDKPSWECSSQLEIFISDLNDNAPRFSQQSYSATLPEDVEIGTLVTKVHATDDDIGINRKIRYEFIDSANDHFTISSDSGIVTLAKSLDRETQAMYNVSIRAMDQGVPQLESVTYLIVNVQDINDNPPEFTSKYYFARVPEIDAVGTEVARVLATSKDTGVNADVYYSIVGGNEHKKFQINRLTGAISIAEQLDYERAKDYYLTIQAIDGGVPPLTNHATVNITVLDSNDNAPIFSQSSYRGSVSEAASMGVAVVQVSAIDLDSNENGQVSYTIERGDRHKQFAIDPTTGLITVAAALDREQTASYNLEIHAKDAGVPTMSNYVVVTVDIEDANDNPPLFDQANYTAVVQEDRSHGHPVLRFKVTDADAAENAAPYTFDFREGNDGDAFRLEQDGTLRTAIKFNSRVRDRYRLHVRVFDNGTPPLYSDTWVEVKIIEESQYPPVITLLEINVNSYHDEYPGGVIGRVHASDKDQYDTLQYALVPTSPSRPNTDLFQIDKQDGTLVALPRLDVGEYRVNISVTDGKFTSYSIAKVNVELVSDDMLENSVIVRFREVSPEDFVLKHRRGFVRTVRNAMKCRPKDVLILSIQPSTETENNAIKSRSARQAAVVHNDLDVLFAVRKPDPSEFYTTASIREALNQHIEELEASTKLVVEDIVRYKCSKGHCVYGECRDRVVLEPQHISPIATDVVAFVSPRHRHRTECSCKEGYAGNHCEVVVNECARSPCPSYRVCVPDSSVQGYSCQCAEGFAGQNCEIDMSKCHDGSCYIPRNPISFSGKSYARYKVDESQASSTIEKQLSLSLRIRTVQPTGNLMYAAGKIDYNVLEIVNGAVQYRFDLGSGEGLVRVNSFYISDGQWHEIELQRDSNTASLSIDGKHLAHGSAPGVNDILNLQSDELYLGAEVRQHPAILGFEDVQRGFVGCMDDVRLARQSVPLHVSGSASGLLVLKRFANVEFSCEATSVLSPPGVCGSQPCQNGGTCSESKSDDDGYECQCHARFRGRNCEIDTDPCASSPCLYAGRCRVLHELGDYECECVGPNLTGKRCEFGRYCNPNPCQHGGICEEGNAGPICKCQGYAGDRCELDVNECERNPCANGATCLNELGSYRCVCPPGTTGLNCANPASYATGLITHRLHITWEHLMWIGVAIAVNVILIVIFVSCRTLANKRRRTAANNINNETRKELVLNSTRPNDHEYKRSSKLSNLEVVQRECPPQCPPRPASYTPSSNNEQQVLLGCTSAAAVALNNLDTLRSYGSAGDELENFPPDYLRNLNRNTGSGNGTMANTILMQQQQHHQPPSIMPDIALDKPSWQEQMQLASFISDATKIKNDLKRASPVVSESTTGGLLLNSIRRPAIHTGGTSIASLSSIEDDPRIVGGYHWDCSDWVRPSHNPLPNITEVPGSEVPDSSSFHSNESNESNSHQVPLLHIGSLDPTRDITTLNEDQESEYVGDSECGTDLSEHYYLHKHHEPLLLSDSSVTQRLNPLDSGSGEAEYKYRSSESYLRHPNTYLPHYNIHTDTESEQQSPQQQPQQPLNGGGGNATTRLLTNKKKNNGVLGGILASDDEHDNNEDDDEDQDLDDDDDNVVPYGFPSARRNRCARATDLVIGTLDERNSLLGNGNNGANNSSSDLSTHALCEIDDADFEIAQQKQSNGRAWHVGGVTQTSV